MRLTLLESGRWTKIKRDPETNYHDIEGAADRLIRREFPGHFALRAVGWDVQPGEEFDAEVCRAVGGLTEHVRTVTFKITL